MCGPCKVLLDQPGVLAASLRYFADVRGDKHEASAAARYYASIAEWSGKAIVFAIEHPEITKLTPVARLMEGAPITEGPDYDADVRAAAIEQAHAFSELCCHRAKAIRSLAEHSDSDRATLYGLTGVQGDTLKSMFMRWAEATRLFTTELSGGEYQGAYFVDGVKEIRLRVQRVGE